MSILSERICAADAAFAAVRDFYLSSKYGKRRGDPSICDLTFGNPHEIPLGGLVTTLRERALPKHKDWFAYKTSEEEPQTFLAQRLRNELALPFEPSDIAMTTGAFAAISVAFHILLNQGDEAVISEPAWFCYEPMLLLHPRNSQRAFLSLIFSAARTCSQLSSSAARGLRLGLRRKRTSEYIANFPDA